MMIDTIMTNSTQEYSSASKEIDYNLIDNEDAERVNNIVCISNNIIIRDNGGMNYKKLNTKQKWRQRWKERWKQRLQKNKYSRKMKMKIVIMIMNATKVYPLSEEDVSRNNETKGILKMINRR